MAMNKALLACGIALAFGGWGCGTSPDYPQGNAAVNERAAVDADADNTARNERDRDLDRLTPVDQGESEADLKVTQDIRQALMDDPTLSFTAKNVKVITYNGKVTLRGPVKSGSEQSRIVAIAGDIAGATNVTDQLEIERT
jgi:osmotically-inducible protein OsmY